MTNELTYTKAKGRPRNQPLPEEKLSPYQLHAMHSENLDLDNYGLLHMYDRSHQAWRTVAPYCLECGHRISKTDLDGKHLSLCRKISNEEDPLILKDGNINYKVWNPIQV
jgi:hypothetical protein